jgi:exosortase
MISNAKKTIAFLFTAAVVGALVFGPLYRVWREARPSEFYSHIPLIPAISAFFFFRRRKKYFQGDRTGEAVGIITVAAGLIMFVTSRIIQADLIGHAFICSLSAIVMIFGSFLALFGKLAFKKALFPLAFLFFMIPLPIAFIEKIVSILATASTGITYLLFKAFGVPFVQEGSHFHLPEFDIVVADACSGIRSSIALLITTVLAGHFFLRKFWKQVLLAVAVFPVTVFKNGVRIITLYLLSYFVDIRIIEGGFLHKSGGFIFFGLGLVMLGYVLWLLRNPGNS